MLNSENNCCQGRGCHWIWLYFLSSIAHTPTKCILHSPNERVEIPSMGGDAIFVMESLKLMLVQNYVWSDGSNIPQDDETQFGCSQHT